MTATAMVELRPGITGGRLAVGVVELAGFNSLRRFFDAPHLERLQAGFEAVWRRVLARRDALVVPHEDRLVYAVLSDGDAIAVGRELVAEAAADDLLLPVRVGVASGTVLFTAGRCYGPAVDAATRRMADAAPGAVSQRG